MNVLRYLGLVTAMATAAACGGSSDEGGGGGGGGVREWTVMVYMAADNNLTVAGVQDLDEMENAGVNDQVQTVVQAEFNPEQLQQAGCTTADCINRPNFGNTFRYAITRSGGSGRTGPDKGDVEEIAGGSNVDMTNPNTLKDFILWAKTNYPANHYLLVLWNHGGGYTGLIQDQTTAGSTLMSLEQLKTALLGGGGVEVVDFDMCLMAGYETLAKIHGLTNFAVFSEEVVPGEGNPYTSVIDGIQANPAQDARTLSSMIVDRFNASYAGNKSSTTLSAYDLAGFAAFETALNSLAADLQAGLAGGLDATISTSAGASQKYTITELTDVVDFLDKLNANVAGQTALQTKIAAVKTAATATTFRINNKARTGNGETQGGGVTDVSHSTGLNIVLPSGSNGDVLPQSGNGSLAAYQALLPGEPWTNFLAAYTGGQTSTAVTDQGNNRFETYLVWDPDAVAAGTDLDIWVLEPNGNIYVPAFGSVTPNGTMSNDSYGDQTNFEGYITNRFVENGNYLIFANLWRDPNDFQPTYDLAIRSNQSADYGFWFVDNGHPRPALSLFTSWLDDETPTIDEIIAGDYTDLQGVVNVGFGPTMVRGGAVRQFARSGAAALKANGARVTPAQLATLRRLVTARRLGEEIRPPRPASLWLGPFGGKGTK